MPIISILAASEIPGAPSRQILSKYAKLNKYSFFKLNDKGKNCIDTDDPAWLKYLESCRTHKTQTTLIENGGTAIPRAAILGTAKPRGRKNLSRDNSTGENLSRDKSPEPENLSRDKLAQTGDARKYSQDEITAAVAEQEIHEARIKKYKADQEEIKRDLALGKYVHIERMKYYFSFFQRAISDMQGVAKKVSADVKHLYLAGKDKEAEELVRLEIARAAELAIKDMLDEIDGVQKDDD